MGKTGYAIEDLLFNHSFRKWVINPDQLGNSTWVNWIAESAQNADLAHRCIAIIHALDNNLRGLSEAEVDVEIARILNRLSGEYLLPADTPVTLEPSKRFTRRRLMWTTAAAIVVIAGSVLLLKTTATPEKGVRRFTGKAQPVTEHDNTTHQVRLVILPDSSKVYLENNSTLSYQHQSFHKEREVYLEGEAFFEINRDPARPFLVYTNNLVTRVLGTSFRVRALKGDSKSVVTVKTGKVSVYKADDFSKSGAATGNGAGVVVTPNQQVIFSHEARSLSKQITDAPIAIIEPPANAFQFNNTPVSQVFETIEQVYGISIVYDEELMRGCSLYVKMGNEPFYDKLKLICRALDATYEMIDGQIFISSNGCDHDHVKK